jgi:hypothetical protein
MTTYSQPAANTMPLNTATPRLKPYFRLVRCGAIGLQDCHTKQPNPTIQLPCSEHEGYIGDFAPERGPKKSKKPRAVSE